MQRRRRAFICDHKDHETPVRVFLTQDEPDREPNCDKGHKMRVQANAPYMRGKGERGRRAVETARAVTAAAENGGVS